MRIPFATLSLLSLTLVACGDEDLPNRAGSSLSCAQYNASECEGLVDFYFRGYTPLGTNIAECLPDRATAPIQGQIKLQLFKGDTIGYRDVATQTRSLQRYFEPYQLWFYTDGIPQDSGTQYIIDGSINAINTALTNAGIPFNGPLTAAQEAQANAIVRDLLFGKLQAFVRNNASDTDQINVAIITAIASPSIDDVLFPGGTIAGLGLSPALVDTLREDDPQADLYTLLGLDADFTPTLFVGHDTLINAQVLPDVIIAHEMGHALGLPHTTEVGHLMTQGSADDPRLGNCHRTLTKDEANMLVGVRATALMDNHEPWQRLIRNYRTFTKRLLAQRANHTQTDAQ